MERGGLQRPQGRERAALHLRRGSGSATLLALWLVTIALVCYSTSNDNSDSNSSGSDDGSDDRGNDNNDEEDGPCCSPPPLSPQDYGRCEPEPNQYYQQIDTSLTGDAFKRSLQQLLVESHSPKGYGDLWEAISDADSGILGCASDRIGDIYSSRCWIAGEEQCSGSRQSDCYNREHSWPQSWFDRQAIPRSDMHHIFPTDAGINSRRGSHPFGTVDSADGASDTSSNGSRWGSCIESGYSGACFEPIDELKGDLARAYFYMSTRYFEADGGWDSSDATQGAAIEPWQESLLRVWHSSDPVSLKEKERNAYIECYQGNRNPFIDYPEWVDRVSDF